MRPSLAALTIATALLAWPGEAPAVHSAWPPPPRDGLLFVHFGEEHWDDHDGELIFPKVIAESAKYRPAAVMASGDKSEDGTVANLTTWREFMAAYDRAGIPYYAAVGNHDRKARFAEGEGVDFTGSLENYMQVFRERPYPFGDAQPVQRPGFGPRERASDDPEGAASHYAIDIGNVRWVFLDNSCYSFVNCDPLQSPPSRSGPRTQMEFLRQRTGEAKAAGKLVFVVAHMGTRDPRTVHTESTPLPHTMGEGALSPENVTFEQEVARLGIDAVFIAHIKGQWLYEALGVPYYIDGGAGGEVYVGPLEETGVDYGYWHGYRLVHVASDGTITTDTVPVFKPGALDVDGPARVTRGEQGQWTAHGEQPTEEGPHVDLELREPAADRPNRGSLPLPAHIWTTSNPTVLRPVPAAVEDPRRIPERQTRTGRFEAVCPGRAAIAVTSGHDRASNVVEVPSEAGPLVRSIRRGSRRVQRGRPTPVARVRLVQPARIQVAVRRRGRTIRTLTRQCADDARRVVVTWDGNGGRRRARLGRYRVVVRVRSDRAPVVRRFAVRTFRSR